MGGEGEDLEPLFDYHRVQPPNFVCLDDDESDVSAAPVPKKAKTSQNAVEKEDEDVKVIEVSVDEDDWLPPPPKIVFDNKTASVENSTIKALRSKKMELLSFTKTVADVMQEAEESAKREVEISLNQASEAAATQVPSEPKNDRAKIVITVQDKDGQKHLRVYADDKFERVFKMYTDKEKLDPQNLVFSFDGDKIDPSTTPSELGMEDDDMIEVHTKKR